jgi:hypothetical protein
MCSRWLPYRLILLYIIFFNLDGQYNKEDLKLLSYHGNHLTVKMKNELFILKIQKIGFKVVTSIPLPNDGIPYNGFDILKEFVATFDGGTSIISILVGLFVSNPHDEYQSSGPRPVKLCLGQ